MYYAYVVLSAVIVLVLNNFFDILKQSYSWWLVPLMLVGFFLVFMVLHFALFVSMIVFTDTKKEPRENTKFFRYMAKITLPIIAGAARVKIVSEGVEKLPQNTEMLFVCNHQHNFDPVIMLMVFPEARIGFIGKKEIYKEMPFIGKAMHNLNSFPIDRENDREAAKTIIKAIKTIKNKVASIALFPEGYTNYNDDTLLPFRNGSFKIATKTQVPIAVCAINNTKSIVKNAFRRTTRIEFRLLEVIYPEQYEGMSTVEIGDMIHKIMQEGVTELKKLKY